jgi:hypothetical protein
MPKPSRTEPFERLGELFAGRQFDDEIIVLCVCWCLRFKLSLRDLVEMIAAEQMMAERGLSSAHSSAHPTIMRWVQYYTPEFKTRHRHALFIRKVNHARPHHRYDWCHTAGTQRDPAGHRGRDIAVVYRGLCPGP